MEHITNVTEFLLAGKLPDRVALRLLDQDYTYGELNRAAGEIARRLTQSRCEKGERVVLISENSFFWVAAYLGTLRAGLVCVPLPANISLGDLESVLQQTEPRFAFLQSRVADKYREQFRKVCLVTDEQLGALPDFHAGEQSSPLRPEDLGEAAGLPPINPDDLAALMFTSGSTGRPRGVMVSHANIMANTESIIRYLELTANDRVMTVLPFHYCFGASLLHTHLRVGGSLVVDMRFMYPEAVLQRMQDTECTGFAGVPSHFQILLRNSSLHKKRFPHLRYVQQAGGHLARFFIPPLREALPGTRVFIMYGQTEATARLSYLPPELLEKKMGSIGKGIPGVKLQVLDPAGKEISPGEVGEIVAEGQNVACGYWRAPEESARTFRNGKLHTGDLATVDEDGYIYVVDRERDFLKCGGKRISCRQLEDRLLSFEGILEAAIIGVQDDVLGEAVKAFIVPAKGHSDGIENRLRLLCREYLPPQLIPKEIVLLPGLPKNSAGKVLKAELRAKEKTCQPPPGERRAS